MQDRLSWRTPIATVGARPGGRSSARSPSAPPRTAHHRHRRPSAPPPPALRGPTVVNLFFEDSNRTRISFEAAD
ncbi:hypothetical protein, partial [Clavibacter michiganensis]|uniref:hypothetical protein n=1 Tax=Clavibacter michiganensis TaxID=28447 RepID=UPI00292FABA1